MFYLNSNERLENLVGLKEQLEVCLTCSRLLAAIQVLLLHQKLRCDSNKITLLNKSWSQPTLVQDPGPSNQLTASPCRDSGELDGPDWPTAHHSGCTDTSKRGSPYINQPNNQLPSDRHIINISLNKKEEIKSIP